MSCQVGFRQPEVTHQFESLFKVPWVCPACKIRSRLCITHEASSQREVNCSAMGPHLKGKVNWPAGFTELGRVRGNSALSSLVMSPTLPCRAARQRTALRECNILASLQVCSSSQYPKPRSVLPLECQAVTLYGVHVSYADFGRIMPNACTFMPVMLMEKSCPIALLQELTVSLQHHC